MKNPEAYADVVILTIKSAIAPLLERLAVSEQCNRDLQARVAELAGLRDRVTTVETKTTTLAEPRLPEPAPDLSPILERVAAAEARLIELRDLRDRVVTVETKAASMATTEPVVFDAAPLLAQIAEVREKFAEHINRLPALMAATMKEAALPIPAPPVVDLSPVLDRVKALELKQEMKAAETAPILASIADLSKDFAGMRERVAVVEVRAQIPGPAGADGKDGQPGQNGVDGLGFDDVASEFDGDRTLTVKFVRGTQVKAFPFVLPYLRYQGVFVEGKSYAIGDTVTWGGSTWHANQETTAKPGDGSRDWTLVVKRGRDGKDGKDAVAPLPVLKVGA